MTPVQSHMSKYCNLKLSFLFVYYSFSDVHSRYVLPSKPATGGEAMVLNAKNVIYTASVCLDIKTNVG